MTKVFEKSPAFFDTFTRKPSMQKTTHYCPGCGHGTLNKIIADLIAELGIQDQTIFVGPVGCGVFIYYYYESASVSAPHGRASAVATGISRANPDSVTISYQGDGDLAAIGTSNAIHAANRGENMIVFLRNTESSGNLNGANMLHWDASGKCEGESRLTPKGKAHARKIGAVFKKNNINPIVISSPMCRCTETASIAFGDYFTAPELRLHPTDDLQGQQLFQITSANILSKHRGNTPIVFINHRPNIDSLTFELINIGELLLGTVTDSGEVEVLRKISIEQ